MKRSEVVGGESIESPVKKVLAPGFISDEQEAMAKAEKDRLARDSRLLEWEARKTMLLKQGFSLRHIEACYDVDGVKAMDRNPAITVVRTMTAHQGISILSGNVGCGKTQAAHLWILESIGAGTDYLQTNRAHYITAAKFARASRYEQRNSKFDMLERPQYLVIDDLGVEFFDRSESFLVDLDELIDSRWSSKKGTLINTNMHRKDFVERYGKRIVDRCKGSGHWYDVRHESMRGSE